MTTIQFSLTDNICISVNGKTFHLTGEQFLALNKQAETTDPDEKYRELLKELDPEYYVEQTSKFEQPEHLIQTVPSELSCQRVRTYIKMLNIAAKLNGEADWNGDGEMLYAFEGVIRVGQIIEDHIGISVRFKKGLALEALNYLNSEDKIAMFGCDKVKED